MRYAAPLAVTLLLSFAVAGCGSGSSTYTLGATKSCLLNHGARIGTVKDDVVASSATGGAFVTYLPDNYVTISFGQTLQNGEQLELGYEEFAFSNVRSGLADVLRRYENAVTLWHQHPADADLALVVGCLR